MLLLAPLLASCATAGHAIRPDPCTGWAAIYVSKSDVLTDGTSKQILAHNEHGAAIGCWPASTTKKQQP
jgi:hypothetical protein